jgi:hypothetical protein
MSKETLKLALEALGYVLTPHGGTRAHVWDSEEARTVVDAYKALEEALKQQALQDLHDENERLGLYEQGEPWGHGGRPMTLRECMEAEEPEQGHSFTYAQMKEQVEGMQRDYDLLLAEYNLLKQEQGEPVALDEYDAGIFSCAGGGDVAWWHDYIRAELGHAYEHYQSQMTPLTKQEQGEPDDLMIVYMSGLHDGKKAQQRKPLTKEDFQKILDKVAGQGWKPLLRAIEAAHGIKE